MTPPIVFKHHGQPFALWNALQSIAEQRPIAAYLEVGVSAGLSLQAVLQKQFPRQLVLCDLWGLSYGGVGYGSPDHIHTLLEEMKYPYPVRVLSGDSHSLLKRERARQFDVILVDGDHSPAGAREDLEDCWRLLVPEGLLVFDDISHFSHGLDLLPVFRQFAHEMKAQILFEDLSPHGVGVLCKTS